MTIEKVQQWVVSALICAVSSFPIGALIITGDAKEQAGDAPTAAGLCVMTVIIGLLAVAAGRVVHRLNPLSPYSLIGGLPGVVGLVHVLT